MPAHLFAVFSRPYGQPKRKGPYARLRFEGELLRERAGGPVIARHELHEWNVDRERFSRLDVDDAVRVQFLRGAASRTCGPFAAFSAVDGVAFQDRQVFAFIDGHSREWACQDDGRQWPVMVVEPSG